MLDHVSIGVRGIARSERFYDAALKPLGYLCRSSRLYGTADAVGLWLGASDYPVPPHDRSSLHFCFPAPTPRSVDQFHRAALKPSGRANGPPGPRADCGPDYYAAIDPDGYRLEMHCKKA